MSKQWTLSDVLFRTGMQKRIIQEATERITNYQTDPEKEQRLKEQLCIFCYYTSEMVCNAFTKAECSMCQQQRMFSNSSVDVLCDKCAKSFKLCVHCGADIEYKNRRKL